MQPVSNHYQFESKVDSCRLKVVLKFLIEFQGASVRPGRRLACFLIKSRLAKLFDQSFPSIVCFSTDLNVKFLMYL